MAVFDESKVINALHKDKAEVGKKYWFSDDIVRLKTLVETNNHDMAGILEYITTQSVPFHKRDGCCWRLLHPYEESSKKKRMTNIQLMEWLSKGKGFLFEKENSCASISLLCCTDELNDEVDNKIVIRPFGQNDFIEPTYEIYLRDCKGVTQEDIDDVAWRDGC